MSARIVIADGDPIFRKNLKALLTKSGYLVIGEAGDGLSALKLIRNFEPDIVVLDTDLPSSDGMELIRILGEDQVAPIILTSSAHHRETMAKAKEAWVFAYLAKPFAESNLIASIEIALANHDKLIRLQREVTELRETLETRKIVEKAKGILMNSMKISEEEAFKKLQKESMNKRISMRQVAEAVIVAFDLNKGFKNSKK